MNTFYRYYISYLFEYQRKIDMKNKYIIMELPFKIKTQADINETKKRLWDMFNNNTDESIIGIHIQCFSFMCEVQIND